MQNASRSSNIDGGHPGYHVKKTIKGTGSTWIKCDTGASYGQVAIAESSWHKIPWEYLDFWISRETSSEILNDFKYWKVDGVQSFKIMNPHARVETIQGAAVQGLPNPLTEVQMYLDSMYDSGVSQQPFPDDDKMDRHNMVELFNSFTNDGVWLGDIKSFPSVRVPTTFWHPNSPGVKKITMAKNKPIVSSWRVNSQYWRSTEEFKCHPTMAEDPPGMETHPRAIAPQSLNFMRTDEHYGYIAPARIHKVVKAGTGVNFQKPDRVFKAYGPTMLNKRQPWGNISGEAQDPLIRTHIRMTAVEIEREETDNSIDDITSYGPLSDLSVKHMCNDPTPNLFLRANTFVNNETNGIEPGIVRIDFEVEIPIVCRGKRRQGLFGPSQLNINPDPNHTADDAQFPFDHFNPLTSASATMGPSWNSDIYLEPVFHPMCRDIATVETNGIDYDKIQQ